MGLCDYCRGRYLLLAITTCGKCKQEVRVDADCYRNDKYSYKCRCGHKVQRVRRDRIETINCCKRVSDFLYRSIGLDLRSMPVPILRDWLLEKLDWTKVGDDIDELISDLKSRRLHSRYDACWTILSSLLVPPVITSLYSTRYDGQQ